jgi:hypothetical protein
LYREILSARDESSAARASMSSTTSHDGSRSYSTALAQEEARLYAEYPTADDIPTCTSHLDEFFRCHGSYPSICLPVSQTLMIDVALGPQFKSMYRQGTLSVCAPKFAEFKFCLSTKTLSPDERRAAWIRRRAEWWAARRVGQSSEDVWEMRRYVCLGLVRVDGAGLILAGYSEPLKNFPPPPMLSPDAVPENTTP